MLLNGDPQNNSLLVEPFVLFGIPIKSCTAWPFPWRTAIESTSPPQTQWDRIPCELKFSTSSVTTQKCHGSSYMHSIKLVHN